MRSKTRSKNVLNCVCTDTKEAKKKKLWHDSYIKKFLLRTVKSKFKI